MWKRAVDSHSSSASARRALVASRAKTRCCRNSSQAATRSASEWCSVAEEMAGKLADEGCVVMNLTIGISPGLAYGDDEALPDRPEGISLEWVLYDTVHGYPGGVSALAKAMDMPVSTLTHKANPKNLTHHFRPDEVVEVMRRTTNAEGLRAQAFVLGCGVYCSTPDQSGGDPLEAAMRCQVAYAEFTKAVADPMLRMGREPDRAVTPNEVRRAEYLAQEAHAALDYQLAALRGRMRKAPEVAP